MRLFSPQPSGEEEPQTAPQQPAHSSPANPSPVVLEDMSPSEVVGHANEASQAHPSARDTMQSAGDVHIASADASLADQDTCRRRSAGQAEWKRT